MQEQNENKETEKQDTEKRSVGREILDFVLYIGAILLITWFLVTFVAQRTVVDGHSMVPTLADRDQLITEKVSYRFEDPKRFDIIVFPFNGDRSTYYIKRIIGLPGETVQIDATTGKIYINGEVLEENYGSEQITFAGRAAGPITLGDDEYFVLGDNRGISEDSRYAEVGNIKRSDIMGRAWLRIYPFSDFGLLTDK